MRDALQVRQAKWQGIPRAGRAVRALDALCGLIGAVLLVLVATIPLDRGSRRCWQ